MKTFDLNIFQLLIILGSIQGLVFAFIIFTRKKFRAKSNVFLGLMVVFISLSNIHHILIDMDYLSSKNIVRKLYPPIQWLIMPMFYLHVNQLLYKQKPKLRVLRGLFLPIVLIALLHSAHFIYYHGNISVSEMPEYYENGLLLCTNIASFIFNGIITFLTYKLLKRNMDFLKSPSKKWEKLRKWYRKSIVLFVSIFTLGISICVSLMYFKLDHSWLIYSLFLSVSFVGYYMGYVGVYRSVRDGVRKNQNNRVVKNGSGTFNKINDYIIQEQLYLKLDLSLSEIAEKFEISSGYLSQLINAHTGRHFSDYINKLRIDSSKKMLTENQFQKYTIESIGLECGFKSKSNFYTAFKKFTGQTPTAYIKSKEMSPVS